MNDEQPAYTPPAPTHSQPETARHGRRIAANTLLLSIRLIVSMAMTFYSSRVVYQTLGVEDFGLLNLMTGLTTSFIFFATSLSNATQRYLSYHLGREDYEAARRVFSVNLIIYITLGLSALIIGEAVGYYLLHHRLQIPPERLEATVWVFHIFLVFVVVQLMTTIYDSVLIARENMRVYAWIGILESGFKLAIALSLPLLPYDDLIVYAALLAGATIMTRLVPVVLCRRLYDECRAIRWQWDRTMGREILGFIGWNGVDAAVWSIVHQGTDILINIYLGPILNAARGIAAQVSHIVGGFSQNFFSAVRSRMTMSYAAGHIAYYAELLYGSSRYGYYIVWILLLPISYRLADVLGLWLGDVPPEVVPVVLWTLAYTQLQSLCTPLWLGILATGQLRRFSMYNSATYLPLLLPIYWVLSQGYGISSALQLLAMSRVIQISIALYDLRMKTGLRITPYLYRVVRPCLMVSAVSAGLLYLLNEYIAQGFCGLIVFGILGAGIVVLTVWTLGTEARERSLVRRELRQRLSQLRNRAS